MELQVIVTKTKVIQNRSSITEYTVEPCNCSNIITLTAAPFQDAPLIDTTLIEYLKLSAPWSMLASLSSLLLLLGLLFSSWYRIALGIRYRSWRLWHVGLSLAAVGLMAFHVVDAGYIATAEWDTVVPTKFMEDFQS